MATQFLLDLWHKGSISNYNSTRSPYRQAHKKWAYLGPHYQGVQFHPASANETHSLSSTGIMKNLRVEIFNYF